MAEPALFLAGLARLDMKASVAEGAVTDEDLVRGLGHSVDWLPPVDNCMRCVTSSLKDSSQRVPYISREEHGEAH